MSILEMSFYGGVMILAVVVLRTLTVHRLPKGTFVVLWLLTLARLLLPFTIPSPASIYTLAGDHAGELPIPLPAPLPAATAPAFGQGTAGPVTGNVGLPAATAPVGQGSAVTVPTPTPAPAAPAIPVWTLVWLAGLAACALFFLVVYVKNQREFRMSLPLENEFLQNWIESHPLGRKVTIRQYDRITAPLTYGLFRPVILLPADTDWGSGEELGYVLEHELIHIRRWDGLTKLLLAAAVCVHWFNPLVWVMFFLANRDLELSCDEGVLRRFGTGKRGEYARTLIGMEETRAGLTLIYNHFSKSALEERVVAIMKTKKRSLAAILAAVVLVAAVALVFATSAGEKAAEPKEVWVPVLTEGGVTEVTWSGELLTGAPDCPEAAEAVRLINEAAQHEVDSDTLPNGRHGYVFADMTVRRTEDEKVYVSVGTVRDIVCISVGERSGYFEAPELYQRIASQNDTPDNVDQEALELYEDAIKGYLRQGAIRHTYGRLVPKEGDSQDGVTAYVDGRFQFSENETVNLRRELSQLYLLREEPSLNVQVWGLERVTIADPTENVGLIMGNSYLDSQFRVHGMGSAGEVLVTSNGKALGFQTTDWLERDGGLTRYDSLEALEADLNEIPPELLEERDEPTFEAIAGEYHFLSGAGGWETVLNVNADGTFSGQYQDAEMGDRDPVKYPNGTVFICDFTGSFHKLRREDNYTWTMEVETLNYAPAGTPAEIRDGVRYVITGPHGLEGAKELTVYLPGTPVSSLPEPALSWLTSAPDFWDPEQRPGTLPFTVLYNVAEEYAFFQGSLLRGDTLVSLENAVEDLDLTWRVEGESLFLSDGAVEIELRAEDYYVYRRGYVTDVLRNPMVLRNGVPFLPISFCTQYLSEGGDLCHAVKYFFKDEIRNAINDPTTEASQRVLTAVSLPRSMGIETINLDPDKIFEERELDDYPEALAAELSGMGVPDPASRAYSEYVVLTEARTVALAGMSTEFLKDLPGEDPTAWTVGEYSDWEQARTLARKEAALTEEQREFLKEKDILIEDLHWLRKDFYDSYMEYPDEVLRENIEAYYQFALAEIMGE